MPVPSSGSYPAFILTTGRTLRHWESGQFLLFGDNGGNSSKSEKRPFLSKFEEFGRFAQSRYNSRNSQLYFPAQAYTV